jgi:hypothetical protein
MLKVINIKLHSKYMLLGNADMLRYDVAYLELEDNKFIKEDQFLEPFWDWRPIHEIFFKVVGYNSRKD